MFDKYIVILRMFKANNVDITELTFDELISWHSGLRVEAIPYDGNDQLTDLGPILSKWRSLHHDINLDSLFPGTTEDPDFSMPFEVYASPISHSEVTSFMEALKKRPELDKDADTWNDWLDAFRDLMMAFSEITPEIYGGQGEGQNQEW